MQLTTIYKISVYGSGTSSVFETYFLQLPSTEELAETIRGHIQRLRSRADDAITAGDEIDADVMYDDATAFEPLIEVVNYSELLIAPLVPCAEVRVQVAGVQIGRILVEPVPASSRSRVPEPV